MIHCTAGIHFIERRLGLPLTLFRQCNVGFHGFLDEPSSRPIELTGKPIELPGEVRRKVRGHDAGGHIQSSLIRMIKHIRFDQDAQSVFESPAFPRQRSRMPLGDKVGIGYIFPG